MVRRMSRGSQFLEPATGAHSGPPDGPEEFLRGHVRRARAGHENPAGRKMLEARRRQPAIRANGARPLGLALRQRRRIQHDQIEFASRLFIQPRKRVGLHQLVPARARGGICGSGRSSAPRCQRMGADVEIGHERAPPRAA